MFHFCSKTKCADSVVAQGGDEGEVTLGFFIQYPPPETDQNQNNPFRDFANRTFNRGLLHNGKCSTHARKREAPL